MSDHHEIQAEASHRQEAHLPADELAYHLRQQRLAADFGYFALRTSDLAELLQEATRVTALGLESGFAKVLEHLGEGAGFLVVAGVGWHEGLIGSAIVGADLDSPAGYAFQTGRPVISNHLTGEQRFRTPKMLHDHGIRRAINVIIKTDELDFGVLEVDSTNEGKFEEADVAFLQGFATLLGVAIQRTRSDRELHASQDRLQLSLDHQQVLTQEISHRVKNSLSVVAGLLDMQARLSESDDVKLALQEAGQRVHTIAAVHDRLWRRSEVRSVSLREFIGELCLQFESAAAGCAITHEAPDFTVSTDQAVTLGLLANELVTNAVKYAYDGSSGPVGVSITTHPDGRLRLTVSDGGKGMPEGFDAASGRSLGIKLIRSLGRQLGGIPEWRAGHPGTIFTIDFEPAKPPA